MTNEPVRLTASDHVLVHACGVLLADPVACENDEMVQSMLRDVLPHVTEDNPALRSFIAAAKAIVQARPDRIRAERAGRSGVLKEYHWRRLSVAWGLVQEDVQNDQSSNSTV